MPLVYNSNPALNVNALTNLSTTFPAGEAIPSGAITVLDSNGKLFYAADPSTPAASYRPIFSVANTQAGTVLAASAQGATFPSTPTPVASCALLSNGNYVVARSLILSTYTPTGTLIATATITGFTLYGTGPFITVTALPGGGFVYTAKSNSNQNVYFGIFDNSLNIVTAMTQVSTTLGAAQSISVAPISSTGGFVVAFTSTAGTLFNYAVYTASGGVTVAPTTVYTSVSGSAVAQMIAVCPIGNGTGFAVVMGTTNGAIGQVKFATYNAAGVVQVAVTNTSTVTAVAINGVFVFAAQTGNGSFAISSYSSAGTGSQQTWIYTSAGVQVGTVGTDFSGANAAGQAAITTLPNGNVAIAGSSASGSNSVTIRSQTTGSVVAGTLYTALPVTTAVSLAALPDGNLAVFSSGYAGITIVNGTTGAVISQVASATLVPTGNLFSTLLNTSAGQGAARGILFASCIVSAQLYSGLFYENLASVSTVGVSTAAAVSGANCPVQYSGYASLATGFVQLFTQIGSNGVLRFNVVGTGVTLYGIQATQQRQIN